MSKALKNKVKLNDVISVKDFGAVGDGITNDTVAMASALAATPTGGQLYFPAGTYIGSLLVWRGDVSIVGAGSASTTIKLPNSAATITVPWESGGTITGIPNVIEIGQCALGNIATAYSNVNIQGLTLDGNYSNNTAPTTDLFGHGLILTKISYYTINDIVAKNCHATGIDCVINSNYGKVNARVADCGNALINGGYYPNFDVNSSKYSQFDVVSSGGKYGGRMLDNCWGNLVRMSINGPTLSGFIYNNQLVNRSENNIFHLSINAGCTDFGVQIGANCRNSQIYASVVGVTGSGVRDLNQTSATNDPEGNSYVITTKGCGLQSCRIEGNSSNWVINSYEDGRTGSQGSSFAVDVYGNKNIISVNLVDTSIWQVRGVAIRSGAADNYLLSYVWTNTADPYLNSGTRTTIAPKTLRGSKTFDAPNLVAGAITSTTVTVTGAEVSVGDFATARYGVNIGGVNLYAEVTATDTVTVWLTNSTPSPIDLGSLTLYVAVEKGTP